MVDRGSMVSRGSVDNRGMVGRGGMDNGGMVSRGSMVSRGGMVDRGGMVSRSMGKHSLGSMKTVRRISNSSNCCAKSLGLCGASVFPLVWLGHRLVGHLTSWATMVGESATAATAAVADS